jgi:cell division protein FtsA
MSRQTLAEVIEPRVEELYSLVQQVLRESGFEELLSSGVVLTGGSAVMHGMVELGEEIFHMPVRIGVPRYQGGLADVIRAPRYATAVGLLMEGASQVQQGSFRARAARSRPCWCGCGSGFSATFDAVELNGKEIKTCSRS